MYIRRYNDSIYSLVWFIIWYYDKDSPSDLECATEGGKRMCFCIFVYQSRVLRTVMTYRSGNPRKESSRWGLYIIGNYFIYSLTYVNGLSEWMSEWVSVYLSNVLYTLFEEFSEFMQDDSQKPICQLHYYWCTIASYFSSIGNVIE